MNSLHKTWEKFISVNVGKHSVFEAQPSRSPDLITVVFLIFRHTCSPCVFSLHLTHRLLWPAAAHLLKSWVRIPPGAWIFVCCECRVLSGRGLCDELITRPEESYRLWCVVVCDLETSRIGAPYIYDISNLMVNDLTLILLTWRNW